MKKLLVSALLLVYLPKAGLSFELISAKGIGMGQTLLLSRPDATTLVNIPTGGIGKGRWVFEGGYNRRFELSDLDQFFTALAFRRGKFTLAIGASQFGKTSLYAEQLLKGSAGFNYRKLTVSTSVSAMQIQFGNNYGALRAATIGAGLSVHISRYFVAVAADNLTLPRLIPDGDAMEPTFSLYTEMLGKGSYSIAGRLELQEEQRPRFGIGQEIKLSKRGSFFWGLSTSPFEYGGGIEVATLSGTISYATSVHPVLGFSHTIAFTYGSRALSDGPGKQFE